MVINDLIDLKVFVCELINKNAVKIRGNRKQQSSPVDCSSFQSWIYCLRIVPMLFADFQFGFIDSVHITLTPYFPESDERQIWVVETLHVLYFAVGFQISVFMFLACVWPALSYPPLALSLILIPSLHFPSPIFYTMQKLKSCQT